MTPIRRATSEDTPQLERLFQLTRQHTFAMRPATDFQGGDYAKSTEGEDVWVAEKNGKIIGFVSTYPADNFIHNLFIHPDVHRTGLGTQLLHIAEATLARPMTLKIAMDNLKACSFYEKHGWVKISTHVDGDEPYMVYGKG